MTRIYKKHDIRTAELLKTAQKLFYSKGYDGTSVEDILKAAEISKGAFYHHFTSKEDLLDNLVKQITDQIISEISIAVEDRSLNAFEKLHKLSDIGRITKFANKELLLLYLKVIYRDENLVLRKKMNAAVIESMVPLYTLIIDQGIKEGVFNTPSSAFTARMIMVLGIGLQEMMWELIVDIDKKPQNISILCSQVDYYQDTLERLLGAPKESLRFVNNEDIRIFLGGGTL